MDFPPKINQTTIKPHPGHDAPTQPSQDFNKLCGRHRSVREGGKRGRSHPCVAPLSLPQDPQLPREAELTE